MKLNQKFSSAAAGLAVVLLSGANAFGIALGDSGTADNWIGMYQSGQGGEFYVKYLSGPVNNSAYSNSTKDQGSFDPSFQTFCLEYTEFLGGSGLSYVVNDEAVAGGGNSHLPSGNQGGDTLSLGTAWLYSQFAQGILTGYFTAANRTTEAGKLQNAIWALEDESSDPSSGSNVYFDAAVTQFGGAAAAQANYTTGQFGVWVLNMTKSGVKKQDMLFFTGGGSLVPDGGSSLVLLGLSLGGISLLARKQKLSKDV